MKNERSLQSRVTYLCDFIVDAMAELQALKRVYPELKVGVTNDAGSILNGYREGDLTFEEAKALLNHEKPHR
jgi:hypothetical protein